MTSLNISRQMAGQQLEMSHTCNNWWRVTISWTSSLCTFLQPPFISSLSGSTILLLTRYCTFSFCVVIKSEKMDGTCSTYGEARIVYKILVGKCEWKRPRGTPRVDDRTKLELVLRGRRWESVSWIHLAQNRVQWRAPMNTAVMNLRVS